MKKYIFILFILVFFNTNAQLSKRSKHANRIENFSIWLSPSYIIQDNQIGLGGKFTYEMEKFLLLAGQSTYFLDNPNGHSFGEYRGEIGFYVFLTPKRRFSPFFYFGLTRGVWWSKHQFEYASGRVTQYTNLTQVDYSNSHSDQSGSFSGGLSYEIGKHRAILEYKYLPTVRSNYLSFGMQFRFFKGVKYKLKPGRINK